MSCNLPSIYSKVDNYRTKDNSPAPQRTHGKVQSAYCAGHSLHHCPSTKTLGDHLQSSRSYLSGAFLLSYKWTPYMGQRSISQLEDSPFRVPIECSDWLDWTKILGKNGMVQTHLGFWTPREDWWQQSSDTWVWCGIDGYLLAEFRAVIAVGQFHCLVHLDMSDQWQTAHIYASSTYNLEDFVELGRLSRCVD